MRHHVTISCAAVAAGFVVWMSSAATAQIAYTAQSRSINARISGPIDGILLSDQESAPNFLPFNATVGGTAAGGFFVAQGNQISSLDGDRMSFRSNWNVSGVSLTGGGSYTGSSFGSGLDVTFNLSASSPYRLSGSANLLGISFASLGNVVLSRVGTGAIYSHSHGLLSEPFQTFSSEGVLTPGTYRLQASFGESTGTSGFIGHSGGPGNAAFDFLLVPGAGAPSLALVASVFGLRRRRSH